VTYDCPSYAAGDIITLHHHRRAQLLYAASGIMTVLTETGTWTVPPQQAVWIPAGTAHELHALNEVRMRSLYILPDRVVDLPDVCRVVEVTSLLRELIERLVSIRTGSREKVERLMAVLIDELLLLRSPPLHLPAPQDPRLNLITKALIDNPADSRDLEHWSTVAGASARTLARLFLKETGMGFGAWRQQLRLLRAIERLAAGDDVTSLALDLGYSSTSAFIAMFKRSLGKTPGTFLKDMSESKSS